MWFFPLKNKAKGKKAPTISWLSGSFYKQQCDEKHMADQSSLNSYGAFCCPLENQKLGLYSSRDLRAQATQPPIMHQMEASSSDGSQQELAACCRQNSGIPFVGLRRWLGDIYQEVIMVSAPVLPMCGYLRDTPACSGIVGGLLTWASALAASQSCALQQVQGSATWVWWTVGSLTWQDCT